MKFAMKSAGFQIPHRHMDVAAWFVRRKDLWVDVVLASMVLVSIAGLILTFLHN